MPSAQSRLLTVTLSLLLASSLAACTDHAKESEKLAIPQVEALAKNANDDVGQVERGLPGGAKGLLPLYANKGDPHQDLPAVRRALVRIRREVPDLTVAKSTFFALADDKGIAIRNDLEEDAMAGRNLVQLFPALSKTLAGEYVTTTGTFVPPAPGTHDKDWIAAAPVKDDANAVVGMLVTGWTLKRYAYRLQEQLRHDMTEAQGNGKLPIDYVCMFDKDGAYCERQTPQVNEQALTDLGLFAKTAGAGTVSGTLTLTDRPFGWAAVRLPKMGDVGVVVLRSEL
jgi:hypothetical protein